MTFMTRRHLLAAGLAAGILPAPPAQAGGCAPLLAPLKWAPRTRHVIENLITAYGNTGNSYNPARRPYAVFDWDNTCIAGDCEESLLHYTANHFAFAMSAEAFAQATARDIPARTFTGPFRTICGQNIHFRDLHADLCADYALLAARSMPPAPTDPVLLSLRAKLVFAYDAINATCNGDIACRWIIRLLAGHDVAGLVALAKASNTWHLAQGMGQETWITPSIRAGRAGIVARPIQTGLRLTPEIADLQSALRQAGIDVYVCSASLEEVVAVFATDPDYGYDLPRQNVLGVRMGWPGGRLGTDAAPHWPVTYRTGKVRAIRQALAEPRGYGPLLVCGDSDGDYAMLTEFPDTRLSLVINRLASGPIGTIAGWAAAQLSVLQPRFVLQGRDENTGEWRPSEQSIPMGSRLPALMAHS